MLNMLAKLWRGLGMMPNTVKCMLGNHLSLVFHNGGNLGLMYSYKRQLWMLNMLAKLVIQSYTHNNYEYWNIIAIHTLYKAKWSWSSDAVILERRTVTDIHRNIIQRSNSGMSASTNVHLSVSKSISYIHFVQHNHHSWGWSHIPLKFDCTLYRAYSRIQSYSKATHVHYQYGYTTRITQLENFERLF